MTHTTRNEILGSARHAGRNVVHTVTVNGEQIGQRRSAHCYTYAFVRRTGRSSYGPDSYVVTRYSKSGATKRSDEFSVFLVMEPEPENPAKLAAKAAAWKARREHGRYSPEAQAALAAWQAI